MRFLVVLLWSFSWWVVQAHAEPAPVLFDTVSIQTAQGADHNLREIPGRIVSGGIKWEPSWFEAVGLGKQENTLGEEFALFDDSFVAPVRRGYELVLAQHCGRQHNAEIGAAFTLRTPDMEVGTLGVNLMGGMGLSYALDTPTYEDGSKAEPGRRYRTQLLILYELEWKWQGLRDWALVTRGHHRSGVYGLIAPSKVGSNFLGLALRYAL